MNVVQNSLFVCVCVCECLYFSDFVCEGLSLWVSSEQANNITQEEENSRRGGDSRYNDDNKPENQI